MGIKNIKQQSSEIISAIPGVRLNPPVLSRLIFTTSSEQNQTYTFSNSIKPGYYYSYFYKNGNTSDFTVAFKNSTGSTIDSVTFSTNSDQKLTYLNTTAASVDVSQALAFSTVSITFASTTANILSIAYGNGIFVATNNGQSLRTSPDLITWTARGNANINKLGYANNQLVAVEYDANSGTFYRSTNGVTWVGFNDLNFDPEAPVSYAETQNNVIFVYSSSFSGTIAYSTNLSTWATRPSGTSRITGALTAFGYGNGLWLAANNSGFITKSTNLVTWTSNPRATTTQINEIVYANGQFFIFATGTNGHRRTTDLVTYTTVAINFTTAAGVISAKYSNGSFLAASNDAFGQTATSTDGITWTQIDHIGGRKRDVLIVNGFGVVVGNGGTASKIELANSAQLQIYEI